MSGWLFASAAAHAQPGPLRPTPLFELETVATDTHATLTAAHVWVDGSWTFQDLRTKTPHSTSGRLSADQLAALRGELARAKWQHMLTQPPCPAVRIESRYAVDGKVVFTEPACGDNLDAASREALAFARGLVEGALDPAPVLSCDATGTPLVVLRDNEETVSVYRSGGWFSVGRISRNSKCLGKDVIDKIASDVADAPWQKTAVIHCMIAATDQTAVELDGKLVFTQRVCNSYKLDDKSAAALAEIEKLMDVTPK